MQSVPTELFTHIFEYVIFHMKLWPLYGNLLCLNKEIRNLGFNYFEYVVYLHPSISIISYTWMKVLKKQESLRKLITYDHSIPEHVIKSLLLNTNKYYVSKFL
jgi:hypothetical protein